ncbi:MAG: Dabb family protein [Kiritimatiellia bacterium]
MITHVVQWKIQDQALGLDKSELMEKLKADLEALPAHIEEILSLNVGINAKPGDAASDVVLLTTFADWDALDRYQNHPAHQVVVGFVKQIVTERRVVDFES